MRRLTSLRSVLCLVACAISILATSARAQLQNGGFETGTFSSWTVNDPSDFSLVGSDSIFANSGTHYANLGASGLLGSLSQTFNTIAGSTYNLSFALANDSGVPPNQFDIRWNGTLLSSMVNAPASPYTVFSFSNLVATGPTTTLQFQYRNDQDFFRLDDVAVIVVPEASTTSMALLGLALLAFAYYRKTQQASPALV